jgi:hypothetical protein
MFLVEIAPCLWIKRIAAAFFFAQGKTRNGSPATGKETRHGVLSIESPPILAYSLGSA